MKAVVLSGGGARGAYQVGAWKALRQLEYDYDIVAGTSIGSVNGLFMVQNEFNKCYAMWYFVDYDLIYSEKFPKTFDKLEIYKEYVKNFIKNGGMSTSKMHELLDRLVKYNKFKKSKVNYGIVTYNLTKNKPEIKLKKDLTKENLNDFILASSTCYPAFQKLDINGQEYIDGGYYDNMPVNLAIEMGATDIIAINLDAVGLQKKVKDKNVKITYIKPRNELGSFLFFDAKNARRSLRCGYNDTMKKFGRLDGNKFTFRYKHLIYNCAFIKDNYLKTVNELIKNNKFVIINNKLNYLKNIEKELQKKVDETVENIGNLYEINDSQIYKIYKFNSYLKKALMSTNTYSSDYIKMCLKDGKIVKILDSKMIIRFIYDLLENKKYSEIIPISNIFAKEFKAALYLHSLKGSQIF